MSNERGKLGSAVNKAPNHRVSHVTRVRVRVDRLALVLCTVHVYGYRQGRIQSKMFLYSNRLDVAEANKVLNTFISVSSNGVERKTRGREERR